MYDLDPKFKVPSRFRVSRTLMPNLYKDIKAKLKKELKKQKYISITCDFCSSFIGIDTESFLGITASYIDEKYNKRDVCLNCKIFYEDHNSN